MIMEDPTLATEGVIRGDEHKVLRDTITAMSEAAERRDPAGVHGGAIHCFSVLNTIAMRANAVDPDPRPNQARIGQVFEAFSVGEDPDDLPVAHAAAAVALDWVLGTIDDDEMFEAIAALV